MERPVIRIYFNNGQPSFFCELANRIYGRGVISIEGIIKVLTVYYYCEKDEDGFYIHQPGYKELKQNLKKYGSKNR